MGVNDSFKYNEGAVIVITVLNNYVDIGKSSILKGWSFSHFQSRDINYPEISQSVELTLNMWGYSYRL